MSTIVPSLFFTIPSTSESRPGQATLLSGSDGKFADLLSQIAGSTKGEQNQELLDISLWLPLLLAQTQDSDSEPAESAEKPDAEQLLKGISEWLQHPELLEQLSHLEGFQEWVVQANALLASTGWMELANHNAPDGEAGSEKLAQAQTQTVSVEVSKQTLQYFLKAVEQQPDSALLAQLKEKLTDLFNPVSRETAAAAAVKSDQAANTPTVDTKQVMPTGKTVTQELPHATANDSSKAAAGKNGADPAMASQLRTAFDLAQKTDMLARLEALSYRSGVTDRLQAVEAAGSSSLNSSLADAQSTATPVLMDSARLELARPAAQAQQTMPMPQTLERFYSDMQGFVLRSLLTTKSNGVSEAKIALYPEHLGHVDVKITMAANGQLTAQLTAHTMAGKEMLEAQLAQLRANLQNQGIQVDRIDVTHADSNLSHAFREQGQQSFQQFSGSRRGGSDGSDFLEDELSTAEELGSIQKELYGNEFNATV